MKLAGQAGKLFAAAIVLSASIAARAATPTFTTLYNFTDGADGGYPQGTLAIDENGVLYGTTRSGANGVGNVYSMTPPSSPGGSWTQTVLYTFTGGSDGRFPFSGVVRGPTGVLYGVTPEGGANGGGVVFALTPPASSGEAWTERVLYNFTSGNDGGYPMQALVRGSDGTLYGTTAKGGANYGGVVFALSPPSSPGASWTEHVLFAFSNGSLGGATGLTYFGGRLYGGTEGNGFSNGGIYSLTPPALGEGAWTWDAVYSFTGGADGNGPLAKLVASPDGVLCGTTISGGTTGFGTAFSLTPPVTPGAPWTLTTIYSFTQGAGVSLLLVPDSGVFFGVTGGGWFQGNRAIFELNPPSSAGGAWTYTTLHYFPQPGGQDDFPGGGLTPSPGRVLYGVTLGGGTYTYGTVFALQL